jgi:multiple sugar transport system substrate-binding protein
MFKTKRYRVLLFFILISLLTFSLYSCKKAEESKPEKIRIHFVTWKPNIPEVWDEIYRRFEERYPHIELIKEIGPHSSTAFHDMLTQKLKNRSKDVDVFLMDVIWPSEFASAGWAMPLDELFPPSEQEKFLKGPILANTYKGRIYGIPLFIDSGMLFYRKDLLQKYGYQPPQTWQELLEQATRIIKEEKAQGREIYGYSGQFKQYEGLVCDMMEFILSNGGYIIDPQTNKVGLTTKASIEAVRFVRDHIIGKIAPRGVLTYQEPESLDIFVQGKVVFHRNWPYAWSVSNNPDKSKIVGKVGVTRLPHFPGGRSYSTLGGWQVGISSFSEHKEEAWLFAKFLTSPEIQKLIALKASKAPSRKALYDDPDILKINPQFKEMKDVFLTAFPRPRSPLYPAISNVLQRYFSKVLSDPQSDILKEAEEATRQIEEIISMSR